ncbi:MAG: hypothetical protein V4805_01160 [Pseudomonadota bacterium]
MTNQISRKRLPVSLSLMAIASITALSALVGCSNAPELLERAAMPTAPAFNASALFALSDADMAGTGYADKLLRKVPGQRDALTRVLPSAARDDTSNSVFASNSVTGWPGPMDIGPACRMAYVAETRSEAPAGVQKLENPYTGLPEGKLVSAFDLSGTGAPVAAGSIIVSGNPKSVHVAPNGRWLIAPLEKAGSELGFVILEGGRPTQVRYAKLDTAAYHTAEFVRGPQFARINPRGDVIALNLGNTHVAFVRVGFDSTGLPSGAELIGQPVPAGKWISMGRWSADGRFYITADTGWGPGDLDAVFNGPGALRSIAFQPDGAHKAVSTALLSLSPEGFDVDPAGKLILAVNMERTYLPEALPFALFGRRDRASLSLVTFDPASGALATVDGPLAFKGVLPEHALFDRDGTGIATAVYHEKSDIPQAGWVEYFHIDRSGVAPRIVPTGRRQPVPRGAHALAVCY